MSSTLCPPCTKPSTLNADRKVQNRGNARARVFKVRLICPAVVTKTRGAETLSAAAGAQLALLCEERQRAEFFRTRTRSGSENIQQEKKRDGRVGPTLSPSIRSQDSTFCTQQIRTKFMNALSYQIDRSHAINKSEHMFCLRQISLDPKGTVSYNSILFIFVSFSSSFY